MEANKKCEITFSEEVEYKISVFKEKLIKMDMTLTQIERKMKYKDPERFGFYKLKIEDELRDLEVQIDNLKSSIERVYDLVNTGCEFGELKDFNLDDLIKEEVEYAEKFITPTVRKISSDLKKAKS